jgi:nuclear-control-of-ATPase protein 2
MIHHLILITLNLERFFRETGGLPTLSRPISLIFSPTVIGRKILLSKMQLLQREFLEYPIEAVYSNFQINGQPNTQQLLTLFRPTTAGEYLSPEEMTELWDAIDLDSNECHKSEDIVLFIGQLTKLKPCIAHLIVLFKLITVLKAKIIEELSIQIPQVSQEIQYWNHIKSNFSVFWYSIQTAPQLLRIPFISRIYTKKVGFTEENTFYEKFKAFNFIAPFENVRSTIKHNAFQLSNLKRIQAHCLGLLSYPSYQNQFPKQSAKAPISASIAALYDFTSSTAQKNNSYQSVLESLKTLIDRELNCLETIVDVLSSLELNIKQQPLKPCQNLDSFVQQSIKRIENINTSLPHVSKRFTKSFNKFKRPSFIYRNWVPLLLTFVGIFNFYKVYTFKAFLKELSINFQAAAETAKSFLTQWIYLPFSNILETIRHKEARLAIMGTNSLQSDLDSLNRMVIDYAKDHTPNFNAELISEQVRSGDLGTVLQEYEKDLQKPRILY